MRLCRQRPINAHAQRRRKYTNAQHDAICVGRIVPFRVGALTCWTDRLEARILQLFVAQSENSIRDPNFLGIEVTIRLFGMCCHKVLQWIDSLSANLGSL